jgi:uncharacterized protein YkwD
MKALRRFAIAAMAMAVLVPNAANAKTAVDPSERMIEAINEIRSDHGLRPLREAPVLDRSATGWAKRIIRSNSFSHGSSYRSKGFRYSGEILAFNRGWQLRPRPALRLWLRSPGHRSLMLSSAFRYVGAGPARGSLSGGAATVWVVHFGAH